MDPVTAFSLAGTAATFVDFGLKLIKLTWSIYHNRGGEEATRAEKLTQLAKSFEQASKSIKISEAQIAEHQLNQLVDQSIEFSNTLVQRLRKEGLLGTQARSAKKAFEAALRHMFRDKELDELKDKIVELERQLSFQLLISLRQFATQTLENQETILSALQVSSTVDKDTTNGTQAILQHVTAQNHEPSREPSQTGLEFNIIEQLYSTSNTETASSIVLTEDEIIRMNQVVLSALAYAGMENRHDRVAQTFEATFEWALKEDVSDQTWHSLPKWLACAESIYWISGKPGSGKSTMMKYLSSPTQVNGLKISRCQPFLQKWAGKKTLIIAPFYFWAADAGQVQRSCEGLLRTLLYHILSARSDLIPVVLPSRWEALAIVGVHRQLGKWTIPELKAYLFHALKTMTSTSCVCFFIDGLDEFDDNPEVLIDLIRNLSSLGVHIKLCIASRPWIEFQDAFQPEQHLQLEDLTRDDINVFVSRKFNQNPEFATLHIREPVYAKKLIQNVVSKSAGVFLWVALVVSSLLTGITNADRVDDLQRRLELLPSDLESLYERILTGLDEFYHQHRAHMIMLMESAKRALPLLVFALADESNFNSLMELPQGPARTTILNVRMNAIRRRLNTRWRGLIEASGGEDVINSSREILTPTVEYLHRSVKDFVEASMMQGYLSKYVSPLYDPHFQLCLAYCGCVNFEAQENREPDMMEHLVLALFHASKVSASKQKELLKIMGNLARAAQLSSFPRKGRSGHQVVAILMEVGVVAFAMEVEGWLPLPFRFPSIERHIFPAANRYRKVGFLVFPLQKASVEEIRVESKEEHSHSPLSRFLFTRLDLNNETSVKAPKPPVKAPEHPIKASGSPPKPPVKASKLFVEVPELSVVTSEPPPKPPVKASKPFAEFPKLPDVTSEPPDLSAEGSELPIVASEPPEASVKAPELPIIASEPPELSAEAPELSVVASDPPELSVDAPEPPPKPPVKASRSLFVRMKKAVRRAVRE